MKINLIVSVVVSICVAASCNTKKDVSTEVVKKTSFFDTKGMDSTIKPGNDFFSYANGGWMKFTKIPDDQKGWGSFYALYEGNQKQLKGIIEDAAAHDDKIGSTKQKVGDYFISGMDTNAIEKKGMEPIKPLLSKIDAVKNTKDLIALLATLNAEGQGHDLFGFSVASDEKNSTKK